jgi:hypothetical protein
MLTGKRRITVVVVADVPLPLRDHAAGCQPRVTRPTVPDGKRSKQKKKAWQDLDRSVFNLNWV